MNLIEIFSILIIHWIGDFILQTDWEAKNKSINNKALTDHVCTYTFFWFFVGFWYIIIKIANDNFFTGTRAIIALLVFTFVTFASHWITDYFTSRLNTKLWKKGDVHNFFVSIGFDQILHYIQLYTTYYILTR